MISFDCSKKDRAAAAAIARRAKALGHTSGLLEIQMDLIATHANGCPLDFARLKKADDFNLAHDVFGIARHLDRGTGQLMNCFLPRFAKKEQGPVRGDPPYKRRSIAQERAWFEARNNG